MDDTTINDLGYVWGRVFYDDTDGDDVPQIVRKNRVKAATLRMETLAMEHIEWPFEAVQSYDY